MSEPRRLGQGEGSALAHALLRSAEGDLSPEGARERVLGRMGLGTVVVSAASLGAAKASPAAKGISLLVAKWTALAALGGAAAIGLGREMYATPHAASAPLRPPIASAVVPSGFAAPLPAPPLVRAVASAAQPDTPTSPRPPSARARSAPVGAPASQPSVAVVRSNAEPAAPSTSTTSEQTRVLGAIRRQIAAREGGRALDALDAFEARYPHSRLGEEVTVLRIDALTACGRGAEAAERARLFLARFPRSAYASHVESAIAPP